MNWRNQTIKYVVTTLLGHVNVHWHQLVWCCDERRMDFSRTVLVTGGSGFMWVRMYTQYYHTVHTFYWTRLNNRLKNITAFLIGISCGMFRSRKTVVKLAIYSNIHTSVISNSQAKYSKSTNKLFVTLWWGWQQIRPYFPRNDHRTVRWVLRDRWKSTLNRITTIEIENSLSLQRLPSGVFSCQQTPRLEDY